MLPQSHKHEDKHPLPLWARWGVLAFVFFTVFGLSILWIIQGSQAFIPIVAIAALGLLFGFLQVFFQLLPPSLLFPKKPSNLSSKSLQDVLNPIVDISNSIDISKNGVKNDLLQEFTVNYKNIAVSTSTKIDWREAPQNGNFYGRHKELTKIKQWMIDDRCRVIALLGMGGIGKTSLAVNLVHLVKDSFDYIIWYPLQNAPPLAKVLYECILFISDQQRVDLSEDIDGQILTFIECIQKHRCLLVLDNSESILQSGKRSGFYREGYESYGKLLLRIGEVKHQSCILLTSREKPQEIAFLEGDILPVRSYQLGGLEQSDGQQVLRDKGLTEKSQNWEAIINLYTGNPLALKLVSQFIQEIYDGDVTTFLKDDAIIFSDIRDVLDQQFNRLSPLEQEVIYWLAIERETVTVDDIQYNMVHPASKQALQEVLRSLKRRHLIEVNHSGYNLQNVILEYITSRFIDQICEDIYNKVMHLLVSHALIKAQAKDYVRESQERVILIPIAQRLNLNMGRESIKTQLKDILSIIQQQPQQNSYAAGNLLNLLRQFEFDLSDYNFSNTVIRQAYLRGISLSKVNFTHCHFMQCIFIETFGGIFSIAFNNTGELLAAGTANGEICLWDATSGMPMLTYKGHMDIVYSVAFSPDGTVLASGSNDRDVKLWDINTGQAILTLRGHKNGVRVVAFSPDGTILASGSQDQTIRLWSIATQQVLYIFQEHRNRVWSTAFNSNGTILASGSQDQSILLWDVVTGQAIRTLWGHNSGVRSVAFSPDGKTLATGSDDQTVRLWDVITGQAIRTLQGHSSWIRSVAFSPDGKTLASGNYDQSIRLWDTTTGYPLKTLQGHSSWVRSVAFNNDGKILASGGEDLNVRLWNTSTRQVVNILRGHNSWIWSVAFSPDGNILASGSQDQTIRLWNANTGQLLKTLQGHTSWVRTVAFSHDGKILASGGQDQSIKLWDVATGQCLKTLQGHSGWIWSIAFSPNGKILVSSSQDQSIRLWNANTGQLYKILEGHSSEIKTVMFSPDGQTLASGSDDQSIRLWNVSTGQLIKVLKGHTNLIWAVMFSPDGQMLASGSDDQSIRLWNVSTGQLIKVLKGHTNRVGSVAFNPGEKMLVSGSDDGTIKFWKLLTGKCLDTHRIDSPYQDMNITGVTGLTNAQRESFLSLGAISY